jgi:hypothetical protein
MIDKLPHSDFDFNTKVKEKSVKSKSITDKFELIDCINNDTNDYDKIENLENIPNELSLDIDVKSSTSSIIINNEDLIGDVEEEWNLVESFI